MVRKRRGPVGAARSQLARVGTFHVDGSDAGAVGRCNAYAESQGPITVATEAPTPVEGLGSPLLNS